MSPRLRVLPVERHSPSITPLGEVESQKIRRHIPLVRPGRVYWLTGLACTGKTTLGRLLCSRLRSQGHSCIHLDGDELREAFDNDLGHGFGDRWRSARRYSRLSR